MAVKTPTRKSKQPTIREIARLANVSVGTVSHVLNGSAKAKPSTAERVKTIAARLGYRPNANAASLRRSESGLCAVVVPNIQNSFFAQFVTCVELAAAADKKSVVFLTTGEDQEWSYRQVQNLIGRRIDGLILVPSFDFQPFLPELKTYRIPLVLADRVERLNIAPSVAVDNEQAGYLGGRHLIERGYRDILFVNHGRHRWILGQRQKGYEGAVREADTKTHASICNVSLDPEEIRSIIAARLKRSPLPQAIFAASNLAARGVLLALQDTKLNVPSDVAMLAMDDFDMLSTHVPPISVVSQPIEAIAATAWRMLRTLIAGQRLSEPHVRLAPLLLDRASTPDITGHQQRLDSACTLHKSELSSDD